MSFTTRQAPPGSTFSVTLKSHTSFIPTQGTQTMNTEGMLCTFSPPPHIHLPFLSLMATVWDTQSPQRPMGFLLSAQSWGKKEPSACHACLKVAAGTRLLKWQPTQRLHEQVWSCARSVWLQAGAWLVPARGLNLMMLCSGSQGACPKGMMLLIYQVAPTDNIFLECFFTELYRHPKDFSLCQKIPIKNKTNKQTNTKPTCLLTRLQNLFPGTRKRSQELQKVQDNIWSTHNFLPQSKSCEYWLTLSYPNFITLDFTRKHVTCKWRHGLPHTQILLKQHTYFTYKSSGSRCTRLWYLIDIYRTWAHCSFILEHSLYSHHNSQDSK